MDGGVAKNKMIMSIIQGGYALEKMQVTLFHLDIRAGYYRVIMYMSIILTGIAGYIVDMPVKIRVFGCYPGEVMRM